MDAPVAAQQRPAWRVVLGLALALPAFILLLTSYVEPLVWTVRSSFQRLTVIRSAAGPDVGFDNYGDVFKAGLGGAFGRALLLAVVPLLVVLLLAPVLAWLAHRGGPAGRWAARGLLALPLAAYAPTAAAAGPVAAAADEPGGGVPSVLGVYWLTGFGLAAALGVTLYLAALRRRSLTGPLVAAAIGGLAVVAVALQSFTVPFIVGDDRQGQTPATVMYQQAFVYGRFGTAAAVSTVLLLALLVFGLAATLLLILTRTRLEYDDERPAPSPPNYVFLAAVGGLTIAVLVVSWLGLGDWLTRITDSREPSADIAGVSVGVNTWLPPVISAGVGVTVAALAAAGISGLRPLGRHSEWLLLPFGLFLFVGVTPLAVRAFAAGQTAGRLDSFIGLIPPTRVAIPALVVLALLVRGQVRRREEAAARGQAVSWARTILPAAPMLLLAYLVTWFVESQDLVWGLLSGYGEHADAQTYLAQALRDMQYRTFGRLPFDTVLPLWALILLILLAGAAQLLYLDRVALKAGRRDE
ncbi:sugar ABC transporter permease [Dactylosporangium sp. CA-139066]|uniref:sugar ABC transporter permease n=1 Tax=Dactylosporangium sp. CA-139066 TaxID=3239930 RepID=UPI003D907046